MAVVAVAVRDASPRVQFKDVAGSEAGEKPTGFQFEFVEIRVARRGGELRRQFRAFAVVVVLHRAAGVIGQGKGELVDEVAAAFVVNIGGNIRRVTSCFW